MASGTLHHTTAKHRRNALTPIAFAILALCSTAALADPLPAAPVIAPSPTATGTLQHSPGNRIVAVSSNGNIIFRGSDGQYLLKPDNTGIYGARSALPNLFDVPNTYVGAIGNSGAIVGEHQFNGKATAYLWDFSAGAPDGMFTNLTNDPNITSSSAVAVNGKGDIVTGQFTDNLSDYNSGFIWRKNPQNGASQWQRIGDASNPYETVPTAINEAGNVVVGRSNDQAFRWTAETGKVESLGTLNGDTTSDATAVNQLGNVVVGGSQGQSYRWKEGENGNAMQQLIVPDGFSNSYAYAVNAAGNVVVGILFGTGPLTAYRWEEGKGMQTVGNWLKGAGIDTDFKFEEARSVNGKGDVVIGTGKLDSVSQLFIARVSDPATTPSGVVGLTDLSHSLVQTLALSSQISSINSLSMNGAHHRTLMDQGLSDGNNCAWVSGDIGRIERGAKGYAGVTEVGACHDFKEQGLRVGFGVGKSLVGLDLDNNGYSRLNGQYGIAEIDWKIPDQPLVASLLGTYGNWNAALRRGYAVAGTGTSEGNTSVNAFSVRARLDWIDAFHLGSIDFSPRIAYTHTRTAINAYQEHGGSAPASFDEQKNNERELRVGLTGAYALSDNTTLLGHSEAVHRFDKQGANVSGSVNILNTVSMPFNQQGNKTTTNWVRLGAEVDHRLSKTNVLNFSTFMSTAGQDASVTVAASWKHLF